MSGRKTFSIPNNVVAFLDRASSVYGKHKEDEFSQFMWSMCCEIQSPIEQLFLIALNLVCETNLVDIGIASDFNDKSDDLLVIPQWNVGNYRVDFALRQHPVDKIVCVELDGHAFHDKNERQRRYEKARDRFLVKSGYSVIHFTGAEVVKDPCAVALEAFNLATELSHISTHPLLVEENIEGEAKCQTGS